MCGLAAIMLLPHKENKRDYNVIRHLFTLNLLYNMERGREATGVCVIQKTGDYFLYKLPIPADKFVNLMEYRRIMFKINDQTLFVLGHTRKPTKGSPLVAANNHPIVAGNVVGIHNGTIENDDLLSAKETIVRNGTVDSEVIFRLLDKEGPFKGEVNESKKLRELCRKIKGKFTTLSVDLRLPEILLVMKKDMPLSVHYEERISTLFFSSRYIFLRKTFGHFVSTEALPSGKIYFYSPRRFVNSSPYSFYNFSIESPLENGG